MTGYFRLQQGNDQFTLVARQGPSYNDDGGCGAYGYYGMLSSDGDAFFKKKLFHHGGYSESTAQRQGVVDNLQDRWIGIKLVVYNLDDGNVKLELWVDDGDETNNWRKATEYVDEGSWEVAGSDCGRDGDETIDEGTRGAFRVDDSVFEFKKLSIREIVGSGEVADGALLEEGAAEESATTAEEEEEGAAEESATTAEEEEEGAAEESATTAEEEAETGNLPTVEIISNGMEGVAPATFEFGAHITGGTEPYTISWDFGDGSEVSDEENVAHTFEEPGRYNIAVTITDSNGETASDNLDVTVEEAAIEEREGGQETE
jgi:hypothetical protein